MQKQYAGNVSGAVVCVCVCVQSLAVAGGGDMTVIWLLVVVVA